MWPPELQPEKFEIINKNYNEIYRFGNKVIAINGLYGGFIYRETDDGHIKEIINIIGGVYAIWKQGMIFYDNIDDRETIMLKLEKKNELFRYLCLTNKAFEISIPEVARGYFMIRMNEVVLPVVYSDKMMYITDGLNNPVIVIEMTEKTIKPKYIMAKIMESS